MAYPEICLTSRREIENCTSAIVVTGQARPVGFWAGLNVQNPGLATLGFSGFGLFRASGFSGLFRAFAGPLRR